MHATTAVSSWLTLYTAEKLKELPVEFSLLTKLKERVELAKLIEIAQHRASKAAHEENWLAKAAEDMEIDLDGDE